MTSLRTFLVAIALLPAAAAAQVPAKVAFPTAAVGAWDMKLMVGSKDSVFTTALLTFSAQGNGVMTFRNRSALARRTVAAGGDSVVSELGPYDSRLKDGLQVTSRNTLHFNGNAVWGTWVAYRSDGSTTNGKLSGAKKTN